MRALRWGLVGLAGLAPALAKREGDGHAAYIKPLTQSLRASTAPGPVQAAGQTGSHVSACFDHLSQSFYVLVPHQPQGEALGACRGRSRWLVACGAVCNVVVVHSFLLKLLGRDAPAERLLLGGIRAAVAGKRAAPHRGTPPRLPESQEGGTPPQLPGSKEGGLDPAPPGVGTEDVMGMSPRLLLASSAGLVLLLAATALGRSALLRGHAARDRRSPGIQTSGTPASTSTSQGGAGPQAAGNGAGRKHSPEMFRIATDPGI